MFDTEEEKLNFSRQLTVCKFNTFLKSVEKEAKILTQDLVIGNENSPVMAEDNDNIELRYKGWVYEENQTLGKLFANIDSSAKKPFRVKLIGKWSQILKGMRIGGKRFAVFSPDLSEHLSGILDNAPVGQDCKYGFDLELIKIQTRVQPKPEYKSQTNEEISSDSLKEKKSDRRSHSNSLNESTKESEIQSKPKSDMISRVTRMGGLPILPMKIEPKAEIFDSIDSKEDESPQQKPNPKPRNSSITSNNIQSNENQIYNNSSQKSPESETNLGNCAQIPVTSLASNSMIYSPYFTPQSLETNLSLLSVESRSIQTEIRMNLTKIMDKIDSVSEKVNEIKNCSAPQINSMSSIGFMDSAILLSSIQRIVNENNSLKKEVEEKTSNLQKLNEKIVDLLHLQNIQSTGTHHNSQELDRLLMSEKLLKREISDLTESCDRFKTQNEELNAENRRLKRTVEVLQTEIESQSTSGRESNTVQSKDTLTQIKRLMNDVFRKINAQIDENKSYKSDEIIEIVSNSIRNTTLLMMDSRNNSRTNSPFRQSIDEIDKNKQNLSPKSENLTEKPSIPQRKSIEAKQETNKTADTSEVLKLNSFYFGFH